MGIVWRCTMVLLSVLAALVIIVNSEEELEMEYRRNLRPRVSDTAKSNFDQAWRAIEVEPMMRQPTQSNIWNDNPPEEPLKRRRPVRKRKRRPQVPFEEELVPEERHLYHENPGPQYDAHDQTTDLSRRRRKRPEIRPNRWNDESAEFGRPLRRRTQRKKLPLVVENSPQLSEFGIYQTREITSDVDGETSTYQYSPVNKENFDIDDEYTKKHFVYKESSIVTGNHGDHAKQSRLKSKLNDTPETTTDDSVTPVPLDKENIYYERSKLQEDTSLSEFSLELTGFKPNDENEDIQNHSDEERTRIFNKPQIMAKDNAPIDPLTLKELLIRSNGRSLSEILQQHNLSLADLLHGREKAISVLQSDDYTEYQSDTIREPLQTVKNLSENNYVIDKSIVDKENKENVSLKSQKAYETESKPNNLARTEETVNIQDNIHNKTFNTTVNATSISKHVNIAENRENINESLQAKDNVYKIAIKRRFPNGFRKKQRIRPMVNTTLLKNQLSRDLIALSTRKYIISRNASKAKQWKDVNSLTLRNNLTNNDETNRSPTTTSIPEDSTLHSGESLIYSTISMENFTTDNVQNSNNETENINTETTPFIITSTDSITSEIINVTERPKVTPIVKLAINNATLRRQVYNNRLKKKRLQQKNSTTQELQNDHAKNLFGMTNLVSASEFIARTQKPKLITTEDRTESLDLLEDFITTTMKSNKPNNHMRTIRISTTTTPPRAVTTLRTVEETAKNEIEEILNDTSTSARLSKILQERNMTINELVEHRERGYSHIHLADIFHNASKEPNPLEPFLSKSVIEPISKETYPLRALLEANLHDPKATTVEPNLTHINSVNIPVVMNFGNNVNENGENMGIIALFNKLDGNNDTDHKVINENTQERSYIPTIVNGNTTTKDPSREYRMIDDNQDIVSWNEIFTLLRRNQSNETEGPPLETDKKFTLDEDVDGDGLIVLEDLQHFNDFDNNVASAPNEKLEVNIYNRVEHPKQNSGILNNIPSSTKSVFVATASIVGLAMVLFLLTYAVFKWKQQRRLIRKKDNFCDDRIHTPVFENRKFHKNNSSSRSISPILSSSNIYTLNTLDSHHDKNSPDYMWDTLRKPFQ